MTRITKRPPRPSVANGDFNSEGEKIRFTKQIILGFLAKGTTKKAAAEMAGISEVMFYKYCRQDPEFKQKVEACLGGEDTISALVNISQAVRAGDIEASKYLLNKTKHYERRYDPKYQDNKTIELTKNPITGIMEEPTDLDNIRGSLLGEEFELDEQSGLDKIEQMLMEQDKQAAGVVEELEAMQS